MKLALPEGVVTTWIQNPAGLVPAQLVASEVRLRGVCGGSFGRWNEVLDFELNATDASHLEILSPPPRAPQIFWWSLLVALAWTGENRICSKPALGGG